MKVTGLQAMPSILLKIIWSKVTTLLKSSQPVAFESSFKTLRHVAESYFMLRA